VHHKVVVPDINDMQPETIQISGRECLLYATAPQADMLLVQPVDEHDLEGMDSQLAILQQSVEIPFQLVAIKVTDWNTELTPWTAPPVFGKIPFGDKAPETLRFITDELLPTLSFKRVVLGGYSLAGLFALWASCNSQFFDGIAAASPSVWYPQWTDYAAVHTPQTRAVYLSLGDKEERARNPLMARVAQCIRLQHELLRQQGISTELEWNAGNHFVDADVRMAKGFAWTMNQILTP